MLSVIQGTSSSSWISYGPEVPKMSLFIEFTEISGALEIRVRREPAHAHTFLILSNNRQVPVWGKTKMNKYLVLLGLKRPSTSTSKVPNILSPSPKYKCFTWPQPWARLTKRAQPVTTSSICPCRPYPHVSSYYITNATGIVRSNISCC